MVTEALKVSEVQGSNPTVYFSTSNLSSDKFMQFWYITQRYTLLLLVERYPLL